ncbi:MAG: DASS family sodium-coupled anion symporter, partial [Candidatus Eisenbacteria bacterium]|nr:DASS family sodium-coupled anion symporter [Candidatus Eisenbacteria bacterium]
TEGRPDARPSCGRQERSREGSMVRRRALSILVAFAVCAAVVLAPAPDGLSREGQNAIAVFALCFVLWVGNALPLSVTSLFAIVLLPTLKVIPASRSFELFGSPVVFFILGAFILAAAMMRSGLSTRLALAFLRRFGGSPRALLAGVIFSGGFLAFWMPEHAVAALLFPIVLEIVRALGLQPIKSGYGRALLLALAWGAVIGGVATFLGGARTPLALGILSEHYDLSITFIQWMVAVAPFSIVLMACSYFILSRVFKLEVSDVSRAREALNAKAKALGPLSRREKGVAVVVVFTIAAWVAAGRDMGLASISIMAAVSLFVFNLIDWKSVEEYVNWGVILMYGGAIAVAAALHESGGARWIANFATSHITGLPPFWMLAVFAIAAAFLTEAISNVAAVALLLPICFGIAEGSGISPISVVFVVAVPAGLAFALPMGTPPNAIAYSAGYYRIRDSLLAGALLKVVALLLFFVFVRFYWPILSVMTQGGGP